MEYNNSNKGILFNNDRKQDEKHPDFKGILDVGGVAYWISGWNKNTSKGEAISISISRKDAPEKFVSKSKVDPQAPSFNDDDLMF